MFLNSKEFHNVSVSFHGSMMKWGVLVFIQTRGIAALFISQILGYVQMTKLCSIVKRSFTILTWKVWVTVQIGDEELEYV